MARRLLRGSVLFAGSHVWRPLLAALVLFLSAGSAFAAGDGKSVTTLVNVADTRDIGPGLAKWVGDLYNGDLWLYGAVVVIAMVVQGALLGLVFDKLIGLLGIRLGKLEHHE